MYRCDECKSKDDCVCIPYGCECFELDLEKHDKQIRADAIDEYNKKIDYLKNCYVDACNMCTRTECDVCAISNFIEDLEQLYVKEQKGGRE